MRARRDALRAAAMLVVLLIGSAVLGAFAGACSPEDPFVPTSKQDTVNRLRGAFMRVIIASPGITPVDVYVDSKAFFALPQGYLDFTEGNNNARYYPVDSLAKKITFNSGGTGAKIAEGTLSLEPRKYYTAYLHGDAAHGYRVLVTADDISLSTVPGKSVKYRVVNLSPDSPPIDVKQDSAGAPISIANLAYGEASAYVASREYLPPKGTGIWVYDHTNGKPLRIITPPYILLPPNATFTIILTGNTQPLGDEPFLAFALFQESSLGSDSLYGAAPITINFGAVRFVNLATTGDSLLDLTFYDASNEFRENDNFRRNYIGQPLSVEGIASAGLGGQPIQHDYFYLSLLLRQSYPFRVEYHQPEHPAATGDPVVYRRQDVYAGQKEFHPLVSRRYTVVAYGGLTPDSAHSLVMLDNTPAPPAGMASVRFFHGAGGPNQGARYRLRIAGGTTPSPLGFGQIPDATNSFVTAPGTPVAEVLDEQGNVVHTQALTNTPLKAGKAYTVFLSRGPFGAGLYLHAMAEDFNP